MVWSWASYTSPPGTRRWLSPAACRLGSPANHPFQSLHQLDDRLSLESRIALNHDARLQSAVANPSHHPLHLLDTAIRRIPVRWAQAHKRCSRQKLYGASNSSTRSLNRKNALPSWSASSIPFYDRTVLLTRNRLRRTTQELKLSRGIRYEGVCGS